MPAGQRNGEGRTVEVNQPLEIPKGRDDSTGQGSRNCSINSVLVFFLKSQRDVDLRSRRHPLICASLVVVIAMGDASMITNGTFAQLNMRMNASAR